MNDWSDCDEFQEEEEDEWALAEICRYFDLINFVDDFFNSEEFHEIIKLKEMAFQKEPSTEFGVESEPSLIMEVPAKTTPKNIWLLKERLKRYLVKKRCTKIYMGQIKTIKTIRKKIAEAKALFLCHKTERALLKEGLRREVLKKIEPYIDVSKLTLKSKTIDRVLCYRKVQRAKLKERKKNIVGIVQKLLNEFKRQKQIEESGVCKWKRKKSKVMKDMDIVGTQMEIQQEVEEVEEVEATPEEVLVQEEPTVEEEKPKKKVKGAKKDKGKKGKKKDKKKGKKDKKKNKKDKKKPKKGAPEPPDLVLPYVPDPNERPRIKPEQPEIMEGLIQHFTDLPRITGDRTTYEKEKTLANTINYLIDTNFSVTPKKLVFNNYRNGTIIRKYLNLLNLSTKLIKCKYHTVYYDDKKWNPDPKLVEVLEFGIVKAIPGIAVRVPIKFSPIQSRGTITGSVMFLTYAPTTGERHHLLVPFECRTCEPSITFEPKRVVFETLPIWKARKLDKTTNYKTIKIFNKGRKSCRLVIRKMTDITSVDDIFARYSQQFREPSQISLTKEDTLPKIGSTGNVIDVGDGDEQLLGSPPNSDDQMIRYTEELVTECVQNVFNYFAFDRYYTHVDAGQEKFVRVARNYVDHVGSYCEKYFFDVYEEFEDNTLECIDSLEFIIQGETTGKFVTVKPEVIDFGVCAFNSIYQQSFEVTNSSKIPQGVGVKFPSNLRPYLSASTNDVYVKTNTTISISIKFFPREDLLEENPRYYDPTTCILQFPLHLCVVSKKFEDTPPCIITIYAILTDALGLSIFPVQYEYAETLGDALIIDLGECTTQETITTDFTITNNSYLAKTFAFVNLPESITIHPNYGFGTIYPLETKTYKLYFSPTIEDLADYEMEGENADRRVTFPITLDTTKNMSSIKKKLNYKKIRKCLEEVEGHLESKASLMPVMEGLVGAIKDNAEGLLSVEQSEYDYNYECDVDYEYPSEEFEQPEEALEEEPEEDPFEKLSLVKSNKLWITALILNPLCEFSHQHVTFPDTPCGSYSLMSVDLVSTPNPFDLGCVCGYARRFSKMTPPKYEVYFEICGGTDEIQVEPTCGAIASGDKTKVVLIARPEIPPSLIEAQARATKIEEIVEKKRAALKLKMEKAEMERLEKEKKDRKKGKGKKDTKKKGKGKKKGGKSGEPKEPSSPPPPPPSPPPEPVITVDEDEIVLTEFDYYPAELCLWRELEPYQIEANFVCTLSYNSDDIQRKPERLYLNATCRVIQPDFIHNLAEQHINFGPTVIGMSRSTTVTFQNIKRQPITICFDPLNPVGPFVCPNTPVELDPENLLKLPVTFSPVDDGECVEYVEIKSGRTVCPLKLSGEGFFPDITIAPEFVVCRLEATSNGSADCTFTIFNDCSAPITIKLVRLCQLVGQITEPLPPAPSSLALKKGVSLKTKKKGKSKPKKGKPKKIKKFSNELLDYEVTSLESAFEVYQGEPLFNLVGDLDGTYDINGLQKKAIKVRFGIARTEPEKGKKGKKGKPGKKSKSGKSTKSSKQKGAKTGQPQKYYVAKYNVLLGNSTFLRDFIIIATFK